MRRAFLPALLVAAAGLAAAPWLVFLHAPIEQSMGLVQKIFYYHVPAAWLMMLSAFVAAGGGVAFLFRRSEAGDRLVASASDLAVLFGLIVLVTGPLWARRAWGTWWVWDARLTSSLLLWLMFVGLLLARRYAGPAARRLSAGLAILGAAEVPLVYASVNIWRTHHPSSQVVRTLDPGMRPAFWVSFAAFTALYVALLSARAALERDRAEVDRLHAEVEP